MALFGGKKESYLGIDVGAGGIKLVELHKTKGRPQLWTYGVATKSIDIHVERVDKSPEDLVAEKKGGKKSKKKQSPIRLDDPRIDTYAALLKQLLKEAKVTATHATASLPVSYVFHSVLTLPEVEEKKRMPIVKAEIQKILSRPIEEMQVVFQQIPQTGVEKKKKYMRLLVTAAPKDLVAFYTAIFERAGLQLQELETEAFALERALVGHDTATVMVVDMGSERTNFFIMDEGLPVTHRSIQIGGNRIDQILAKRMQIDASLATQIKRDLTAGRVQDIALEPFSELFDPILKEIEYGFDLYLKQSGNEGKRPEKIILTGGSSLFVPIQQRIAEAFEMKVFVGDPWARVVTQQGLKPILSELGPRMAVSIGLALRNIVEQ